MIPSVGRPDSYERAGLCPILLQEARQGEQAALGGDFAAGNRVPSIAADFDHSQEDIPASLFSTSFLSLSNAVTR